MPAKAKAKPRWKPTDAQAFAQALVAASARLPTHTKRLKGLKSTADRFGRTEVQPELERATAMILNAPPPQLGIRPAKSH